MMLRIEDTDLDRSEARLKASFSKTSSGWGSTGMKAPMSAAIRAVSAN